MLKVRSEKLGCRCVWPVDRLEHGEPVGSVRVHGTVGYRYAVPASVAPNGLPVAGMTSKTFYVTTS